MFSIIRFKKPRTMNQQAAPSVIVCRVDMDFPTASDLAYQLATSDANINNGTHNHTLVTRTDKGAWYELLDGSLVMYRAEPE